MRLHEAALDLEYGKQSLLAREYTTALEQFTRAGRVLRGRKLKLVRLVMRTAPSLLRAAYARRVASSRRRAGQTTAMPAIPTRRTRSTAQARTAGEREIES